MSAWHTRTPNFVVAASFPGASTPKRFGRGKEPIYCDDLSSTLLNFAAQQVQELA